MLATIENMQSYYRPGVLAYSPETGEQCSATPGDYWNAPAGWTMEDSEGNAMRLVTREVRFLDIEPVEASPLNYGELA